MSHVTHITLYYYKRYIYFPFINIGCNMYDLLYNSYNIRCNVCNVLKLKTIDYVHSHGGP